MMEPPLARHLPLITSRIEFRSSTIIGDTAIITPRMDFAEEWSDTISDSGHDEDKDLAPISDHSESEPDNEDFYPGDNKIPKPAGEPGRPGSGGYNIESKLVGWSPDLVTNINVSPNSSRLGQED